MNPELKEKMQQAADEYSKDMSPFSRQQSNDFYSFMKGVAAMYAELVPLVEWVSVEYRLPETGVHVLCRNKILGLTISYINPAGSWINSWNEKQLSLSPTHWRRIEL